MLKTACIGFCRSNNNKYLQSVVKDAMEGKISEYELYSICKKVKSNNWQTQRQHGVDIIPCNDFSFYDHMLDATCFCGNIQRRYYWEGGKIPLGIYFSLANGMQKEKFDVIPLELRNWLNTNYLYHVPEFVEPIEFVYSDNKQIVEYLEAKALGITARPVILSPISYLLQGKSKDNKINPIDLLDNILQVYEELFSNCKRVNIYELQFDDPMICFATNKELQDKYTYCYKKIREYADDIKIHLVTYYSSIIDNFDFIQSLPINSIHIDVPYNYDYVNDIIEKLNKTSKISVGIVDARSLWKNNLSGSIDLVSKFCDKLGDDNVVISNSSPLFLCPYSVEFEKTLSEDRKNQLSFGLEKIDELAIIKKAINDGKNSVKEEIKNNSKLFSGKKVYSYYKIDIKNDISKTQKQLSVNNLDNFYKKNNIKIPAMMLADAIGDQSEVVSVQNNYDFDVVSITKSKNGYDNSYFNGFVEGCHLMEENVIPRYGNEYYYPFVIFDTPKFNSDIFVDIVKYTKKNTKKPIKLSTNSPIHFINFSFVSPFLKPDDLYKNVVDGIKKCIDKVIDDVDLLQLNEFTFITNCDYQQSSVDDGFIIGVCDKINEFIVSLKNKDNVIVINSGYNNVINIIRYICELNVSILLLECYRSCYEILNKFVTYKPNVSIGFGLFDSNYCRISSKFEMIKRIEKILSYIDSNKIVLTSDNAMVIDKENMHSIDTLFKRAFQCDKSIENHLKKNK